MSLLNRFLSYGRSAYLFPLLFVSSFWHGIAGVVEHATILSSIVSLICMIHTATTAICKSITTYTVTTITPYTVTPVNAAAQHKLSFRSPPSITAGHRPLLPVRIKRKRGKKDTVSHHRSLRGYFWLFRGNCDNLLIGPIIDETLARHGRGEGRDPLTRRARGFRVSRRRLG